MNAFRDAIADAVGVEGYYNPEWSADAILALPEMQAIRSALWALARYKVRQVGGGAADHLEEYGLPESVIDWVVDE